MNENDTSADLTRQWVSFDRYDWDHHPVALMRYIPRGEETYIAVLKTHRCVLYSDAPSESEALRDLEKAAGIIALRSPTDYPHSVFVEDYDGSIAASVFPSLDEDRASHRFHCMGAQQQWESLARMFGAYKFRPIDMLHPSTEPRSEDKPATVGYDDEVLNPPTQEAAEKLVESSRDTDVQYKGDMFDSYTNGKPDLYDLLHHAQRRYEHERETNDAAVDEALFRAVEHTIDRIHRGDWRRLATELRVTDDNLIEGIGNVIHRILEKANRPTQYTLWIVADDDGPDRNGGFVWSAVEEEAFKAYAAELKEKQSAGTGAVRLYRMAVDFDPLADKDATVDHIYASLDYCDESLALRYWYSKDMLDWCRKCRAEYGDTKSLAAVPANQEIVLAS